MRKMKALSLLLAAALTVSSVAVNDTTADAAKKPKLSKSKVSITVGQKYKIKLKNGAKKAKVTWKTSKKSTVKIVKKSTKGKAAFAQVKGVKKGKAVITASYKLGKSKAKTLKCTVTVKKAAPVNTTNAPATAAAVTTPTSPAKNTASAAPSKAPENSKAPEDTKAPDKTAKPSKTPKPTATVKPSAEPNPDLNPDVIDIMKLTYLDLAEGIVKTDNADGSVTLDFTGTSYKGARWYFGTAAADEDSEPVQKALNLENYSYVVVEGVNQAGVTADADGKVHDLSAQLLDALDHADHGGLLEIDTQANMGFPLKFELTDKTKRTNVAAFEIYSLGDDQSVKAGPITIKSIKAYKDKATYDKIMAEGDATPEPSKAPEPTATPEPTETAAPTETPASAASIDLSTATKIGNSGTVNYDADSKVLELSDAEGALIRIGRELPLGTKVNVTINGETTDGFRAWLSQGEQNASAIVNPIELGKTYEFTVEDFQGKGSTYADTVQIKGLTYGAKIGSLKITSIKVEEIIPATPEPTETPAPVDVEAVTYSQELVLSENAVIKEASMLDPATTYADGKINLVLAPAFSGGGVRLDLGSVDLSEYDIVIDYSAEDEYPICYSAYANGTGSYWSFSSTNVTGDRYGGTVKGNGTITLSSDKGGVVTGLFFKYNTWVPAGQTAREDNAKITLNSVKFVDKTGKDAYIIPDDASKVYIKGNASGIDVNEELDVVDYADLGDYVATYKDAFGSFTKMADKTAGTIEKPVGDKNVVYTAKEANKGTVEYNGKTTDVEFVKTEGAITAKFERQGHAFEATAVDGEDGVINIKKDGTEGYVVKVNGDSNAFTVNYTTASGKVLNLVYDGNAMAIVTDADINVAVNGR